MKNSTFITSNHILRQSTFFKFLIISFFVVSFNEIQAQRTTTINVQGEVTDPVNGSSQKATVTGTISPKSNGNNKYTLDFKVTLEDGTSYSFTNISTNGFRGFRPPHEHYGASWGLNSFFEYTYLIPAGGKPIKMISLQFDGCSGPLTFHKGE